MYFARIISIIKGTTETFLCLFLIDFAFGACVNVKLPAIFSDNMVLQQQSQ